MFRFARAGCLGLDLESDIDMSFKIVLNNRHRPATGLVGRLTDHAQRRPGVAAGILLASGLVLGLGASVGIAGAYNAHLTAKVEKQDKQLAATRAASQREINALAARLGELQAQANRLNALGERLTRAGQLEDGEFDFEQPVPTGGPPGGSGDRTRAAEFGEGRLRANPITYRRRPLAVPRQYPDRCQMPPPIGAPRCG